MINQTNITDRIKSENFVTKAVTNKTSKILQRNLWVPPTAILAQPLRQKNSEGRSKYFLEIEITKKTNLVKKKNKVKQRLNLKKWKQEKEKEEKGTPFQRNKKQNKTNTKI